MTGRHRGVRREYDIRGDGFEGGGIGQAALDQAADTFEDQEGGMAFVDVPDRRFQAEGSQGAGAADAEQDFLFDAGSLVAAIEAVGDFAVAFAIGRQPGIEQDEPDVTDGYFPDFGLDGSAGEFDGDQNLLAIGIEYRGNRQVVEVGVVVGCLLVAVGRMVEQVR